MDLEEFVAQSLTQIVAGVKRAQQNVEASGAAVNPSLNTTHSEMGKQGFLWSRAGGPVQIVQFDVALTVVEGTGTKGGIGVFAGAVNLGSSGQSSNENRSVSHLKFAVPLALPHPTKPNAASEPLGSE
jgi:hypothetical protein